VATALVLTVGNEIVSGDVENTNASWLARRLASLGVSVELIAAIRDDVEEIGAFLRAEAARTDFVFVTGGLGGTPDDLTREGVASAFGVECEEIPEVAARLRGRFDARGLGGALRRRSHRDLAPQLSHRGGPDRGRPRRGDAPPPGGDHRKLPTLSRGRSGGRDRPEIRR
jgi:molybdenum cofactor synthesis domain-containing protein